MIRANNHVNADWQFRWERSRSDHVVFVSEIYVLTPVLRGIPVIQRMPRDAAMV